jgi:ABC-type multidrug transport system fused ATPase/permease subunit
MGNKCGAHTIPYIKNNNSTSTIEHEATTTKINEEQLYYCNQRGLDQEEAGKFNSKWFLQRSFTTITHGIRSRSTKACSDKFGRKCWIMLNIKNLEATIDNKHILKGLNLNIKPGEVHAIMGPNGSGKSTLANVLSGKNGYEIKGEIKYNGESLSELSTEERAQKGIFLAFQYPLEIPGVNTNTFLRTSLNSVRKGPR